ncbi:MAG: hypothetical protein BWX88_03846 [Planctomycetes bacterium ADurb.Bin126]|nr:MAG: hypothetical protein BWX88_03846 [Planctomycetes bacterium ADurb.Bin126]
MRRFLKQHGISDTKLATWHEDETKAVFLRRLFDDLITVKDNKGHSVILSMARSLAEMKVFPDLEGWPDTKEKLAAAREAVSRIKAQIDFLNRQIQDTKAAEERQRKAREKQEQAILSRQTLAGLADRLAALVPQQGTREGGYAFERWFYDLAGFFELSARPPYVSGGRQIDGSLGLDGTEYLIETKFTKVQTAATDVDSFMLKIKRKADNTMGILVSMSGFSGPAIKEASCDGTPMLLMDFSHVYNLVLAGMMSLPDVIRRIKQHASQTGEAFLPVPRFSG